LAKSQYQTGKALNQIKLLEMYTMEFEIAIDEKNSNTKITKPQVKVC
jgi:hypothetical protein